MDNLSRFGKHPQNFSPKLSLPSSVDDTLSPVNPTNATNREHAQKRAKIPCNNRGCKRCGSIVARLSDGNERHPASLVCAQCGTYWRWMGKLEFAITTGQPLQSKPQPQPRQLSLFEGGEL